jgi:hypothetical protein
MLNGQYLLIALILCAASIPSFAAIIPYENPSIGLPFTSPATPIESKESDENSNYGSTPLEFKESDEEENIPNLRDLIQNFFNQPHIQQAISIFKKNSPELPSILSKPIFYRVQITQQTKDLPRLYLTIKANLMVDKFSFFPAIYDQFEAVQNEPEKRKKFLLGAGIVPALLLTNFHVSIDNQKVSLNTQMVPNILIATNPLDITGPVSFVKALFYKKLLGFPKPLQFLGTISPINAINDIETNVSRLLSDYKKYPLIYPHKQIEVLSSTAIPAFIKNVEQTLNTTSPSESTTPLNISISQRVSEKPELSIVLNGEIKKINTKYTLVLKVYITHQGKVVYRYQPKRGQNDYWAHESIQEYAHSDTSDGENYAILFDMEEDEKGKITNIFQSFLNEKKVLDNMNKVIQNASQTFTDQTVDPKKLYTIEEIEKKESNARQKKLEKNSALEQHIKQTEITMIEVKKTINSTLRWFFLAATDKIKSAPALLEKTIPVRQQSNQIHDGLRVKIYGEIKSIQIPGSSSFLYYLSPLNAYIFKNKIELYAYRVCGKYDYKVFLGISNINDFDKLKNVTERLLSKTTTLKHVSLSIENALKKIYLGTKPFSSQEHLMDGQHSTIESLQEEIEKSVEPN